MSESTNPKTPLEAAHEFVVLFLAFTGRDHGTPREEKTMAELQTIAASLDDMLRAALDNPAAGTSAYEMIAAVETQNVEVTETLIHMVAATVLAKLIDEEGGGRTNISFSPADMDEMHQRYMMHSTRDGLITTVKIEPRQGAFDKKLYGGADTNDDEEMEFVPTVQDVVPPTSFYAEAGPIDSGSAEPQAKHVEHDRPLWAARINGKLYPASGRLQAGRVVTTRSAEEPNAVVQVENRFCYHDDCPAERCNRTVDGGFMSEQDVPDQDTSTEVTSDS